MTIQPPVLLVVDDDEAILKVVGRFAARAGFEVVRCSSGREATACLAARRADLAMVDLRMPEVGGLDVLRAIRDSSPNTQTILMTGFASVETAVEAIKLGALDYLTKPLDFTRLDQLLASARDDADRRRMVFSIEHQVAKQLEFCGMIGRGAAMQDLFGMIRRLAPHVRTALISGETGTGKKLVGRALHTLGPRRARNFVAVNCSAAVETLLESELFGHVRGAFSGASEHRVGGFGLADGGTVFLDEVGELPLSVQARLLRVLELGETCRLGSLELCRVNVQVLAASTRDLRQDVASGRFRSDLYYRLNVAEVALPPLRDRREDLPYLTAAFVRAASERLQKPLIGLTARAEQVLAAAAWPGNVRELRNVVERACVLAEGEFISERDLGALAVAPLVVSGSPVPDRAVPADGSGGHPDLLTTVERDHIMRALARVGGNKQAAARILGLSRRALYRRIERLDLTSTITRRPRRPSGAARSWPSLQA